MSKKSSQAVLMQDIGLLIFIMSVIGLSILMSTLPQEMLLEGYSMAFIMFIVIVFALFERRKGALVIITAQIIGYTLYKIFTYFTHRQEITLTAIGWLVIPIVAFIGIGLFSQGRSTMLEENKGLNNKVSELVLIDITTGLYNIKGFYYDMQKQMRLAHRNQHPLTLMIIRFRYEEELRRILSRHQFQGICRELARIVETSLRFEDRLFCMDKKGGLAAILNCDANGAEVAKARVLKSIFEKEAFNQPEYQRLKIDVQIGCLQYTEDLGYNAILYKQRAESELQYNV